MKRAFVSAFVSSRVPRHVISRLPTQQSQKLTAPLPLQALQRTKHRTHVHTPNVILPHHHIDF